MAKQFSDFSFCGKRISDLLNIKYISVEYDSDPSKSLGLERDMQKGESTRYRIEPNYFYDTWSAPLEFDLHILKDTCKYQTQTEMEITKSELREITRWLTSSHYPEWIRFSDEDGNLEEWRYKGWFSNVETFVAYGTVYGFKLHFKCTTSFAWTDVITNSCVCTTYKNMLVKNDGDDLNDYSYPTIKIHPIKDEEIFICNESDYTLLENGKISVASDDVFNTIVDKAENYAKLNGYDLEYTGKGAFNIVSICNDTGVQFKLIDNYGCETLCTVFYNTDTKEYKLISGGFMYMKVYKDLDVVIDCKNMTIEDSIGRMVTYDKLGISDIGYMYWLRLMNGNNSIMLHGNCEFTIEHIEARKVGE